MRHKYLRGKLFSRHLTASRGIPLTFSLRIYVSEIMHAPSDFDICETRHTPPSPRLQLIQSIPIMTVREPSEGKKKKLSHSRKLKIHRLSRFESRDDFLRDGEGSVCAYLQFIAFYYVFCCFFMLPTSKGKSTQPLWPVSQPGFFSDAFLCYANPYN